MVHWLKEELWFIGSKEGFGSLVKRRAMVHWLKSGLWFIGYRKVMVQ
jgi:hypothetical protein